ncbi:MAG TPA: aminoglycoside phosphotransferase family protein [Gaiellaceae bacterium]|nr:aminoglycoside phosphotransferase family protein [Gaiellaceae bacterium]
MSVEDIAEAWGLALGDPYLLGAASEYVGRVQLADSTPAVLKIGIPHRESEHEADALERWDGDGAARLLRRDDARNALLLERCEPGTFLSDGSDDPLGVLIELLPRLWKDPAGFTTLADEVAWWDIQGEVGDLARELAASQGELVLVHQDLHGENVLAAEREPWLVIDPKPLAAEREFSVAPIVRSGELGHSKRDVFYRLDRLCAELGLDRERARGWTIVQTVAWGGDASVNLSEVVEWLS